MDYSTTRVARVNAAMPEVVTHEPVCSGAAEQERYFAIATEHGTPCYVLDLVKLRDKIRELDAALKRGRLHWSVLYSVKTNYLPIVLQEMRAAGNGCDCVSGYELELALRLGFAAENIVFNGPLKTREELAIAVDRGILINIDGAEELSTIAGHAQRLRKQARVGIRLNPGRNVYPSADPSFNAVASWKARHSKFGWNVDDAATDRLIDEIVRCPFVVLEGVQCHLGSQITDPLVFAEAVRSVVAKAAQVNERTNLKVLNIGGGFGVAGIQRDRVGPLAAYLSFNKQPRLQEDSRARAFSVAEFVERIEKQLETAQLEHLAVACEPGRYLISDSMTILTRVHSVKRTDTCGNWVVVDAGLNILPTAGPAERRTYRILSKRFHPTTESFMLGGPLCYEGDVFSFDAELPSDISAGDLMLIEDAGAYSVSRSTNFIRPRAPVIACEGDRWSLCWKRETYEDIFRFAQPQAS